MRTVQQNSSEKMNNIRRQKANSGIEVPMSSKKKNPKHAYNIRTNGTAHQKQSNLKMTSKSR